MIDNQRHIERVRKMLALANNDGATEGERDNALRMAHATIAKYNLDRAALEASGTKPATEERVMHRSQFFGRPWARRACAGIATLFFCEYLYIEAARAKDTTHLFIGKQSNAITAAEMARWVVECIMKEGKKRARQADEGNAYYRSFATGAAIRVASRALAMRAINDHIDAPQVTGGGGIALVLASIYRSEEEANKRFIEVTLKVKKKSGRSGKGVEHEATNEGYRYGDSINLSQQVGSERVAARLK